MSGGVKIRWDQSCRAISRRGEYVEVVLSDDFPECCSKREGEGPRCSVPVGAEAEDAVTKVPRWDALYT
jgi:hypothetical protein